MTESKKQSDALVVLGALLLCAGCVPALGVTGFMPVFDFGFAPGVVVATLCGATGGGILARTGRPAGLVGGALIGVGSMLAVWAYARYVRTERLYNVEVVLVMVIGAVPGALLWSKLRPAPAPPEEGGGPTGSA